MRARPVSVQEMVRPRETSFVYHWSHVAAEFVQVWEEARSAIDDADDAGSTGEVRAMSGCCLGLQRACSKSAWALLVPSIGDPHCSCSQVGYGCLRLLL